MTPFETLSLLLSAAGSVGVIVSLLLLRRQTDVFRSQLFESLSRSMTEYSLEISRLFLQNHDLRPYFFDGKSMDENHPDYMRAEAVAEVMLDIFWIMRTQAKRVRGSEYGSKASGELWANYVGDCFAKSPMLTNFLTKRKAWYGDELVHVMERGIARSRQSAS